MRIKQLLPLALLILALTACAPAAEDQVEIVPLPQDDAPLTMELDAQEALTPFSLAYYWEYSVDPAFTEYRANLTLSALLYEGLFQLDESFQPQTLLCQSYTTSNDGLTWTFAIRPGISFSDGTPLTAQLVAESLQRSAQSGSNYESRLSDISSIQWEDSLVMVTLSTPNSSLPALLDVPITLPDEENELVPLGTGRYVLEGDALLPNGDYWQSSLRPDSEIPLHGIRYTDDLVSSFDAGYVSLVDVDLMGTQAPYFSTSYQMWDYSTTSLVYLAFNNREVNNYSSTVAYESPCASVQLRQIIAMAVDRSAIVSQDYAQHAVASTLPVHPASPLYDPLLAVTGDYSSALLTAAVAELTPLEEPLILLTSNENATRMAVAQRIVDELNRVGISIQLSALPWDDYLLALEDGAFDFYLAETQLTADFDITPLIGTGASLNFGQYTSATTDGLLSAARSATNGSQSGAVSRLYTQVLEDVPIVPICFKNGSVLIQWGRISHLTATQSNPFYQLENWVFSEES